MTGLSDFSNKFTPDEFRASLPRQPGYAGNQDRRDEIDLDPVQVERWRSAEDIASAAMQREVAADRAAQKSALGSALADPARHFQDLGDVQPAPAAQSAWAGFGSSTGAIPAAAPTTQPALPAAQPQLSARQPTGQPPAPASLSDLKRFADQKAGPSPESERLRAQKGGYAGAGPTLRQRMITGNGYQPMLTPGISPNALPADTLKKQGDAVKGSALPELQAQYARQGIAFDPNALYEKMNYGVEGKGSASGYRKVDPNRQAGSFSVVPGLSDGEKQRYAQIMGDERRNAEYAKSQKQGQQYDALMEQQGLNAVKQAQAQQQAAYQNQQLGLARASLAQTAQRDQQVAVKDALRLDLDRQTLQETQAKNRMRPLPQWADVQKAAKDDLKLQQLPPAERNKALLQSLGLGLDEFDEKKPQPYFLDSATPEHVGQVGMNIGGKIQFMPPEVFLSFMNTLIQQQQAR